MGSTWIPGIHRKLPSLSFTRNLKMKKALTGFCCNFVAMLRKNRDDVRKYET